MPSVESEGTVEYPTVGVWEADLENTGNSLGR